MYLFAKVLRISQLNCWRKMVATFYLIIRTLRFTFIKLRGTVYSDPSSSMRVIMISPFRTAIFEIALFLSSCLYHSAYKASWKAPIKEISDNYETFYISDRAHDIFVAPSLLEKIRYTRCLIFTNPSRWFLRKVARSEFETRQRGK